MSNPNIKHKVYLSPEQRQRLQAISRNGSAPVKKILHARVLLMADQDHLEGRWSDAQISEALDLHLNTVARIRQRFVLEGEAPALNRRARLTPPVPAKLDGEQHAHLVAICCSEPPEGRVCWTLTLLVDELKRRGIVSQISRETVRQSLKKINYDRGRSNATASPKRTLPASLRRWKRCSMSTAHHTAVRNP